MKKTSTLRIWQLYNTWIGDCDGNQLTLEMMPDKELIDFYLFFKENKYIEYSQNAINTSRDAIRERIKNKGNIKSLLDASPPEIKMVLLLELGI